MPNLGSLPEDCLIKTFQTLSVQDLARLSCTCTRFKTISEDDALWKILAFQKWGNEVENAAVPPGGWKAYCCHRMNTVSLPPSPINLIQEQYPDPWQHITCCIMCARTTGGPTIRDTIAAFFRHFPTPSAVMAAPDAEITAVINPLGLQAVRCASVKSMSRDFLLNQWENPQEFNGCGKFVSDSFKIFCRKYREVREVTDVNLQRYLRWILGGTSEEAKRPKKKARIQKPKAAKLSSKRGGNQGRRRTTARGVQTRSSAPTTNPILK